MANDGKMKELWEKMNQAEKWADEHEYQKLLNKIQSLKNEKESYFENREGSHPRVRKIEQELAELERKMRMFKDDDATEHGSIETYGKEKETETMPLEKNPVQAQDAYQNGEHVKVKNRGTGEIIELKVLKDNGDGTLEVKAPNGAVITIKESWIYKGSDKDTKDGEPTNAVKDSYDMLKLCGIITHDTKPLVGEVVEVDSPRVGQFTGRCVSVSSNWADIKILHMKNGKEPGTREGDIVSVNFEYIKV